MSNIFRSNGAQAQQSTIASGVAIQSSVLGRCIPVVYGTTVVAPNLILYGNFKAIAPSSTSNSGKGGLGGTGGKGQSGSTSTSYFAALAFALCMGPIAGVRTVYVNKGTSSLAALGFSLFTGTYPQAAWGTVVDTVSTALGYNGIAYIAAANYSLGTSPTLPNHKVEVQGLLWGVVDNDAVPDQVLTDILTNTHYGVGFPAARLGDLTTYNAYCYATSLFISPAYTEQRPTADILDELMIATNSELVWSSGKLNVVPRGDTLLSANGKTYTPPAAALYDLTDDDFLDNQSSVSSSGSSGGDPIAMVRKRASDALNTIKFEFLDRANQYASGIAEVKRQELIDLSGGLIRSNGSRQMHMFASAAPAQTAAQLFLQRQAIRNTYGFTLDARYILLDPMDIVTLTDSVLGLSKTPVRILEITENDDGSLNFLAEDYLAGVGANAVYSFTQGQGPQPNWNASPGNSNPPIFFEPPDQLGGGLFVYMALSGGTNWGGAQVWVSVDGATFRLQGTVSSGPARMGVLTAPLAAVPPAVTGATVDQTDTLSVDLSQSAGVLNGGTVAQALALSTACYVDGEYVAYVNAALTGTNKYDLSYLVRGAYGSAITAHAAGSKFARLDRGIFALPFTQDMIGKTIAVKILSFNVFNGGLQGLGDVGPYTYTITGAALSSPLPNVVNLRAVFVGSVLQLLWDEIADFRPVQYQISKGTTFAGAQILRVVAHPPFATQGDGTYWVTGISQPTAGLTVQSGTPQSLSVATSGSTLVDNVIATWDEAATGWGGSFTGGAVTDSIVIRTGSNGNFLGLSDFLGNTDFLNAGGAGQASGTYTIPDTHIIKLTSAVACKVTITWSAIGQAVSANFLGLADFLGKVDFLDYGLTSRVNVYPQIRVAQGIGVGFLSRTDFLGTSDFLNAGSYGFGPWQKYETGYYVGLAFQAQMVLTTNDSAVIAEATAMTFSVDVPDRVDTYNLTLGAAASSVTFQPEGAAAPAAFNGGPGSSAVPIVSSEIVYAGAPVDGDKVVISALTLSSLTVAVRNAGANVARNVHLTVQGF